MALKVLIAGFYHSDSGKTVLASSLVSALRSEGFKVAGFKPVGLTDLWTHPSILEESLRARVILTRDGLVLYRATGAFSPTVINPVGGLSAPVDPRVFEWKESILDAILATPYSRMVAARLTACTPEGQETRHYFNTTAFSRIAGGLRESIADLVSALRPPCAPATSRELAELIENEGSAIADTCLERISDKVEVVVAESNADIAVPTRGLMRADLVVVVARNVAAIVSGLRYSKAVELRMRQGKPWSVTTREIAGLLSPQKTVELPLKTEPEEGYTVSDLEAIVEEVKSLARR